MKKSIVITSALVSCFLLTACGSQSSSSKESSSTAAQSSTAKSSSKKSSQSDSQIQKASSSSDSSATTSSTAKTAKVDDKTTGVMLALLVEPDWFNVMRGVITVESLKELIVVNVFAMFVGTDVNVPFYKTYC